MDPCGSAIVLTDYWRKVYNSSERHRYECDPKRMNNQGRPWFRFSGAAGSKLMNTCPPRYSCGSNVALWSNAVMPTKAGEEIQIPIFGEYNDGCNQYRGTVLVRKCSTKTNDFVYKYTSKNQTCFMAFCGMD